MPEEIYLFARAPWLNNGRLKDLAQFVVEKCELSPVGEDHSKMVAAYRAWCRSRPDEICRVAELKLMLRSSGVPGFILTRGGARARWNGIALRGDPSTRP